MMRNLVLTLGLILVGSINLLYAQDSAEPVWEQLVSFEVNEIEEPVFTIEVNDSEEKGNKKKGIERSEFKKVLYQIENKKNEFIRKGKLLAFEENEFLTKKATETANSVSYESKKKKSNPLEMVNDVKKFVEDLQKIETAKYDFILEPDTGKFQNIRQYKLGVTIVLKHI